MAHYRNYCNACGAEIAQLAFHCSDCDPYNGSPQITTTIVGYLPEGLVFSPPTEHEELHIIEERKPWWKIF